MKDLKLLYNFCIDYVVNDAALNPSVALPVESWTKFFINYCLNQQHGWIIIIWTKSCTSTGK